MGRKSGMSALTTPIQFIILELLATATALWEEIKGIQFGKKGRKLPVLADNMIVYVENLMNMSKNVSRTNKFSKVIEYNYISTYYQWTKNKQIFKQYHL